MANSFKPDDRCVMTYVSAYYHAFAGALKVLFREICFYFCMKYYYYFLA